MVGDVAKTKLPVPVSSVTAASKFALVGVAKNVATFVPSPLIPVAIGNPVAFVSVILAGVFRMLLEGRVTAGVNTTLAPALRFANAAPVSRDLDVILVVAIFYL
jgi:hypothetical protein